MSAVTAPTRHELRDGEVHLWFPPAEAALRDALCEEAAGLLSPDESARWRRISHARVRRRFVMGRALMRQGLAQYLGDPAAGIVFDHTARGKPVLVEPEAAGLVFNLSHGGSETVLAVARGRQIGVDMESTDRTAAALDIAGHFYTDEERTWLGTLGDGAGSHALMLWTLKESVTKAMGATVWDGLAGVRLAVDGKRLRWLSAPPGGGDASAWDLVVGRLGPKLILAVALNCGARRPVGLCCRSYVIGGSDDAARFQPVYRSAGSNGWSDSC